MPKQYRRSVPLTKEQNEWFDAHPEINFAGFTRMAIQTFINTYDSPKSSPTATIDDSEEENIQYSYGDE